MERLLRLRTLLQRPVDGRHVPPLTSPFGRRGLHPLVEEEAISSSEVRTFTTDFSTAFCSP